jgi:hypothetical protein
MLCTVAYCEPVTRLPLRGQRRNCSIFELTDFPFNFKGEISKSLEDLKQYYEGSVYVKSIKCKLPRIASSCTSTRAAANQDTRLQTEAYIKDLKNS